MTNTDWNIFDADGDLLGREHSLTWAKMAADGYIDNPPAAPVRRVNHKPAPPDRHEESAVKTWKRVKARESRYMPVMHFCPAHSPKPDPVPEKWGGLRVVR